MTYRTGVSLDVLALLAQRYIVTLVHPHIHTHTHALSGAVYTGAWANGNREGVGKMTFNTGVSPDLLALLAKRYTATRARTHALLGKIYEGEWENDRQKLPSPKKKKTVAQSEASQNEEYNMTPPHYLKVTDLVHFPIFL